MYGHAIEKLASAKRTPSPRLRINTFILVYILPQIKSRSRHKSSVKSRAQSPPVPIPGLVSIKGIRLLRIVTSFADPAAPQARTGIASGMERAYPSVRITAFLLNPAFEARRT
jgi:hypothetical protein